MSLIEAVLTYRPHGYGADDEVPVGKTSNPRVLLLLRNCLLEESLAEAHFWQNVDPGIAAMRSAEAERLARVLGFLLPDQELGPHLGLVDRDE